MGFQVRPRGTRSTWRWTSWASTWSDLCRRCLIAWAPWSDLCRRCSIDWSPSRTSKRSDISWIFSGIRKLYLYVARVGDASNRHLSQLDTAHRCSALPSSAQDLRVCASSVACRCSFVASCHITLVDHNRQFFRRLCGHEIVPPLQSSVFVRPNARVFGHVIKYARLCRLYRASEGRL